MRRLNAFLTASSLLVASVSLAGPAGLAESTAAFAVERANKSIPASAGEQIVVGSGDRLVAGDAGLRLRLRSGEAFALEADSALLLESESRLVLEQGSLALSQAGESAVTLRAEGLDVAPMAASSTGAHTLIADVPMDNAVVLSSQQESFTIRDSRTGAHLAILAAGDSLVFRNIEGEWTVRPLAEGAPSFLSQSDSITEEQIGATGEEDKDERRGLLLFSTPVIVAGAVGTAVVGGTLVVTGGDDGDDKGGDGGGGIRPPASPAF